MKKLSVYLLLILTFHSCGESNNENQESNSDNKFAPNCEEVQALELLDESKSPPTDYTGTFKVCNPKTGKIYFTGEVVEGKAHGKFISYNRHGQILGSSNYKNGLENGPSTKYHNNGKIKWEQNYVDGRTEGERKEYTDNGKLIIPEKEEEETY